MCWSILALNHPLRYQVVNSPAELTERQELVGVFGLYALYRRLCPANVPPDPKFYKKLWAVQKDVPIIILHAKIVWFPPDFLMKYAAFDVRKLEPQDVEGDEEIKRLLLATMA